MVSVIIPTFNRAELLARALKSVQNQTFKDFEIIVVDDASTDSTASEIKEFNVKYIQLAERSGVSAARNKGAELARGEWLAFLDSDDEWLPQKLEKQIAFAEKRPEYFLIHTEEQWVRHGARVNVPSKYKKRGGWIFLDCLPVCAISPSTVMIKKEKFNEFGGFHESYPVCEDYHLWLKIAKKAQVGLIDEALTIKHGGREDQLSAANSMDYYRVLALDEILLEEFQQDHWREEARKTLLQKCDILLKGYVKHQNLAHYDQVLGIQKRWI